MISAAGSDARPLTDSEDPGLFARFPDWSPDCAAVAFQGNLEQKGNRDIYVMPAGGGPARRLTRHAASNGSPDWSPDATSIAFTSGREEPETIYIIGADGDGLRRLTDGPAFQPAWSPDGRRIAFHSTRDFGSGGDSQNWHAFEIYVMGSDGSEPRRLTDNVAFDGHPDWCQSSRDRPRLRMR